MSNYVKGELEVQLGYKPASLTTTKMNAYTPSADGFTIYNTTTQTFWDYINGAWVERTSSPSSVTQTVTTGNQIAQHDDGLGTITPILESVVTMTAIANGVQLTTEDGTTNDLTFTIDQTTPSDPRLLVQLDGSTQANIPLQTFEVEITAGGLTLDPITDVLSITETNGDVVTVDLTRLRTTISSADNSVTLTTTTNPDNSTNIDLSVPAENVTDITGLLTGGNTIGTYNAEDGTPYVLQETITALTFDPNTRVLTFDKENGTQDTADLSTCSVVPFTNADWVAGDPNVLTISAATHGLPVGAIYGVDITDTALNGQYVIACARTNTANGDVIIETRGATWEGDVRICL